MHYLSFVMLCRLELEYKAAEEATAAAVVAKEAAAEAEEESDYNKERLDWRKAELSLKVDKAKVGGEGWKGFCDGGLWLWGRWSVGILWQMRTRGTRYSKARLAGQH